MRALLVRLGHLWRLAPVGGRGARLSGSEVMKSPWGDLEKRGGVRLRPETAPDGAATVLTLRLLARSRRAPTPLAGASTRVGVLRGWWALRFASTAPRSTIGSF